MSLVAWSLPFSPCIRRDTTEHNPSWGFPHPTMFLDLAPPIISSWGGTNTRLSPNWSPFFTDPPFPPPPFPLHSTIILFFSSRRGQPPRAKPLFPGFRFLYHILQPVKFGSPVFFFGCFSLCSPPSHLLTGLPPLF